MTEKLYENDSFIKEFTATVIFSDEKGTILDRTAFFPEGGGQYGDTGYINGVRVRDTQIKDGVIYHITETAVEPGSAKCALDWNIRYDRMQNHTGEHILSGVIHERYGYNNVGFHLSDDEVTLDLDGKFTDEDIVWLETEVNRIIDQNKAVKVFFPTPDELQGLEYRSKLDLSEGIRIVVVDGVDKCACCAPHVAMTAEVGLLKIVKHYNYKNGTRMHILCGERARRDYIELARMNTKVVNAHSAKRYELCDVVCRLEAEIFALKDELRTVKSSLIDAIVSSCTKDQQTYIYFEESFTNDDIMRLADSSIKAYPEALTCAFCGNDSHGYGFVIGGKDAKEHFARFKADFNARGGGRDVYQGKVQATKQELEEYFNF